VKSGLQHTVRVEVETRLGLSRALLLVESEAGLGRGKRLLRAPREEDARRSAYAVFVYAFPCREAGEAGQQPFLRRSPP
jgi:hypothetical protein